MERKKSPVGQQMFSLAPFHRPMSLLFPSLWGELEDQLTDYQSAAENGVRIWEDERSIHVEAPLPGISAEEIEVTLDRGILWISGQEKRDETKETGQITHHVFSNRLYRYRLPLPQTIDDQHPETALCDGLLKITFSKKMQEQAKRIPIKTSAEKSHAAKR